MAHGFVRDGDDLVARLDGQERELLVSLCEQVLELVAPHAPAPADEGGGLDPFEAIVAGMGTLSTDAGGGAGGRDLGLDEDRDPALDRLFPAGHREDPEAAAEFRRFTEPSLRARKGDNLRACITALTAADDELRLDRPGAVAFTVALTDIRLVMGERLGLRDDADAERIEQVLDELDEDDPVRFALALYDFLTWLQESVTRGLMDLGS